MRPARALLRASAVLLVLALGAPLWPTLGRAQGARTGEGHFTLAVLSFEARRGGEAAHSGPGGGSSGRSTDGSVGGSVGGQDWLGLYLQETLAAAFVRTGRVAAPAAQTATLWRKVLGLRGADAPDAEGLRRMGVDAAVSGTTQTVLSLAQVRLRAAGPKGDLLQPTLITLRLDLERDAPSQTVDALLDALGKALLPDTPLGPPPMPPHWRDVEALYTVLAEMEAAGRPQKTAQPGAPGSAGPADAAAVRPKLMHRIEPHLTDPVLGGRAALALAQLELEQALLHTDAADARGRRIWLEKALHHATVAARADPHDAGRLTLKGEIHFFLEQYYEAKTEASIARMRNPLDGLAFLVLGLTAGLSTGEGHEYLKRSVEIDPFLDAAQRPPNVALFQGGLLEPHLSRWRALNRPQQRGVGDTERYRILLAQGITEFEAKHYGEAEETLQRAAGLEENDYTPWLYLYRIMLETDREYLAVSKLELLAAENPLQPDILLQLGLAQSRTDRHEEARESLQQAFNERPENDEVRLHLAREELALEHWPVAEQLLRPLLQRMPERADVWLRVGIARANLEQWEAADAALKRAAALSPEDLEVADWQHRVSQRRATP